MNWKELNLSQQPTFFGSIVIYMVKLNEIQAQVPTSSFYIDSPRVNPHKSKENVQVHMREVFENELQRLYLS